MNDYSIQEQHRDVRQHINAYFEGKKTLRDVVASVRALVHRVNVTSPERLASSVPLENPTDTAELPAPML